MIHLLHIKNIGIIDDLTIHLNEGFNVLTGETGARKNTYYWSFENFIRREIFQRNDANWREKFICGNVNLFVPV